MVCASQIDEFAARVHPRDGHSKIFAMLDAYIDESGIHEGAQVCVVAGYFGGRCRWKKFEHDWKRVLKQFAVPMEEFHAKDLYPAARGWFRHHWQGKHSDFLNAIADTIASHPKITPISVGIVVRDFNAFSMDARRYFTGATLRDGKMVIGTGCPNKPYFVPFQRLLIKVCDYAPVGGRAHFFFGLDRPFYEYATVLYKRIAESPRRGPGFEWKERLGDPSYPLAKETPQLQAADFLVNLTYHHMLDAGDNLGTTLPSPLLAKCIANKRSNEDFFFDSKPTLQWSWDVAVTQRF